MESEICLFDVDGTLTRPRQIIDEEMLGVLDKLQTKVEIGIVSGSDFYKVLEQLRGMENLKKIKYVFTDNGLVYHRFGELVSKHDLSEVFDEEFLNKFSNQCLQYLSTVQVPYKRGSVVQLRTAMLNVSPIGRNCTPEELEEFGKFDETFQIRKSMIENLKMHFSELGMDFAIGGMISFDAFPVGWDKRYCLRYLENNFSKINFYGDKTFEGGNDHDIYHDRRVIGHHVTGPEDTLDQIRTQFGI